MCVPECVYIYIYMFVLLVTIVSVQFSSIAHSCLTLSDPMDCSMQSLPVHHQLPEFTQTQPIKSVMPSNHLTLCRPLSGSFQMSQFFISGGQSIGVSALALPMNIQD